MVKHDESECNAWKLGYGSNTHLSYSEEYQCRLGRALTAEEHATISLQSSVLHSCGLEGNQGELIGLDTLPENPRDWLRSLLRPADYAPIRCVILGQDPYHTRGKANGLAFGIHSDYQGPISSSIRNIIEEVHRSTGQRLVDLSLESWVKQGVLLTNTRLTVQEGRPMSHAGLGWEEVVAWELNNRVIEDSIDQGRPLTWLLWGREAREFARRRLRIPSTHVILETSHPCQYSAHRGFRGCGHFAHPSLAGIKWGLTDAEIQAEIEANSIYVEKD